MCIVARSQTKPKWIQQTPKPGNSTYLYKIGFGTSFKLEEAKNRAFVDLFAKAASQFGIPINTKDVISALQKGQSYEVISSEYNIPINIVCEYEEETQKEYKYYILGQVPKSTLYGWTFDDCRDCYAIDKSDQRKVNRTALAWSIIPGGGQIYKNHKGLGYTIIGAEALLIGSGVVCYFIGQNQQDIMNNHKTSYNDYQTAKNTYNTVTSLQPWLYGAAAVVYVANLATAYWINDNRDNKSVTFVPAIMPTNDNLAVGIGINYKF